MSKKNEGRVFNRRAYGSIGHFPGSKLGPGDHKITGGQEKIAMVKPRDKHDLVIVQEKLDGSCVCVSRFQGKLVPVMRAGYRTCDSSHLQHHYFDAWVRQRPGLFSFLEEGDRICGEWLMQVHGTHYDLSDRSPYVAFDILSKEQRIPYAAFAAICKNNGVTAAPLLHIGNASLSIADAELLLGEGGHYGADKAEGAVWRVENKGKVDFLGKYVRSCKEPGIYMDQYLYNYSPTNFSPELNEEIIANHRARTDANDQRRKLLATLEEEIPTSLHTTVFS